MPTQPPITRDQELAGYRASAACTLRRIIEQHEGELMVARAQSPVDERRMDQVRYQLLHLFGYYRGIQDAIEANVEHRRGA